MATCFSYVKAIHLTLKEFKPLIQLGQNFDAVDCICKMTRFTEFHVNRPRRLLGKLVKYMPKFLFVAALGDTGRVYSFYAVFVSV